MNSQQPGDSRADADAPEAANTPKAVPLWKQIEEARQAGKGVRRA